MAKTKEVAIRKRQKISQANKNMFIAVALASAVVGFCSVTSVFLFQKMTFNAKVIGEKNDTIKVLKKNNEVFPNLEERVTLLNYDDNLKAVMKGSDGLPIRVIADALPSTNNPAALGASMSDKLLTMDGVTIESINMTSQPVVVEDENSTEAPTLNTINFSFLINGTPDAIRASLDRLEKSIRNIDIVTSKLTYLNNGTLELSANANAYYSVKVVSTLKEKEITP